MEVACEKVGQSESETFHVCKGVRQGCTLCILRMVI